MRKQTARLLLFCLSICFAVTLPAQKGKLRKAALLMETLQYEKAISVYEKLHRKNDQSLEPVLGIAVAHRKQNQLQESASWYAKALELPEVQAATFYDYGHVLFQQGECEAAQAAFREFLRRKPYDERQQELQDVCALYEALEAGINNQIRVSAPNFNGPYSDLAPAFYNDGLVFGSVREGEKRREAYYDLFFTRPLAEDRPDGISLSYEPVQGFSDVLNGNFNEAILSFNPDFTEVYFTRNQEQALDEKHPVRRLEVMVARLGADSTWSVPETLPVNSQRFSTAHPALSPDGQRLFFSSDRPGGFGGKDIYYADRLGLGWSSPINLGPKINTEGDELYPYYDQNGELYFASDGHLGLGGLDIFRAEDLGEGQWGKSQNLGQPLNSKADDFALVRKTDGSYGFFTSNRTGGQGSDDIYAFQERRIQLEVQLLAADSTAIRESLPIAVRGEEYLLFSDEEGKWTTWLTTNDCRYLRLRDERYADNPLEICASAAAPDQDQLVVEWVLKPAQDSRWADNQDGALLEGILMDELTGAPIAGADLSLEGADCTMSVRLTTDDTGYFSYLADSECCFELSASADGYFFTVWPQQFCSAQWPYRDTFYLTPYRLQANQDLPTNGPNNSDFQVGRQVYEDAEQAIPYLLNVYYDLGRASVRPEAIAELNRLYWLLDRNPEIVVEIGSHTDSRGTDAFNDRLSQRRANAIVRFLVDKGITDSRLQARGYGETRPVNGCTNGVDCSEEEHQLNRRTEFRVIAERVGQHNH
ncbi:MAG: OmpA family protein [Bacteroidota bacterium]